MIIRKVREHYGKSRPLTNQSKCTKYSVSIAQEIQTAQELIKMHEVSLPYKYYVWKDLSKQ